jgi:hypothetical protein
MSALTQAVGEVVAALPGGFGEAFATREALTRVPGEAPDEFYFRVAGAFRYYSMKGNRPLHDIAAVAEVPYSTAAGWVAEARARRQLEPTKHGRGKGTPPVSHSERKRRSYERRFGAETTAKVNASPDASVDELENITGMSYRATEPSERLRKVVAASKTSRKAKPPTKRAATKPKAKTTKAKQPKTTPRGKS